jgi:hypothetical protein
MVFGYGRRAAQADAAATNKITAADFMDIDRVNAIDFLSPRQIKILSA